MAFSKQACKKLDLFGQHLLKAATTKGSIRVQSVGGLGNYTIFALTLRLKYTIVFFYKQKSFNMRQDLKHRLVTWKNDVQAGEIKKVFVTESPEKKGEYLVKLEKSMNRTFGQSNKEVKVSKKYLTSGQVDAHVDPATDMYHVNRVIDSLEREFNDKFDATINETFKDEVVRYSEI
jgi:citrate lyase gamma subunit